MELWIRSQDKERLIKVDKIRKYDKYSQKQEIQNYMPKNATRYEEMQKVSAYVNDKYLGTIIVANDVEVGEYNSKERALEVLDEIQKILKPQLIIKDSGKIIGSFEDTIIREGATYEIKELATYVYEMPQE